jgi:CRISPR-associated endonuclease/helicase Cas3
VGGAASVPLDGEIMIYRARENQLLSEHLTNTAELAKTFASVFGCEKTAYSTGLLHDLGKYTHAFQDYLNRGLRGEKVTRGEVIHALQGAKFSAESFNDTIISDIIGNIIATHHGGLFDSLNDGERTLLNRINKSEEELHFKDAVEAYSPSIDTEGPKAEILNICRISQTSKLSPYFMLHLITKALYSCLVDADRCDAAGIKPDTTSPDWIKLIGKMEKSLAGLADTSALENIRKQISEQCQAAGRERQRGIYTLSVPTGGGKTLSSLRFALEHAMKHNMKRIIYVIPYLSILDQTAAKLRKVFSECDDLILEHHSNFELPQENDDDEEQYRLLTARWDSPIILTTMVQFLETIYSNKASKLRKFHSMSESVIVFDEIQALPIKCVHLFNDAANFLNTFGKATILLCTATQPHLHETDRPVLLSDKPDLVCIPQEKLDIFERVYIEDKTNPALDYEQIAALVKMQIDCRKSTLVILNTKGDARKIYDQCKDFECEKAFLTTDLCPEHRLNVLDRLRKNLNPGSKKLTLCISTQLIEAGVDISFDCVIRAGAGMDSIIQAAGRCNRNKENSELQPVIVIDVNDENLSRLPEIKEGKSVTARIFRENKYKNLLCGEVIDRFYYYHFFEQKNKMDYTIKDTRKTIYSLLNDNPIDSKAYENRNKKKYDGLPSAFETAAEAFSVIDGGQTGIVVPYGDAMKLVASFQESWDPKEKMGILKQLQKYSVSVYSDKLEKIKMAIIPVENTFFLLSQDYYDANEYGLLLESKFSFLNI